MSLLLTLPVEAERVCDGWIVRDAQGHEHRGVELLYEFESLAELQWFDATLGATFDGRERMTGTTLLEAIW